MRILMLADSSSSHTLKWVESLEKEGIAILLFSLYADVEPGLQKLANAGRIDLDTGEKGYTGSYLDMAFYRRWRQLRARIRSWQPDILHAQYASSYGFLGALSGFRPFVISVWGSDIFSFPNRNPAFKAILKYSLGRAGRICSSSEVMGTETGRYCKKPIDIIPFGVNLDVFSVEKSKAGKETGMTVGTVKRMAHIYGSDVLLEAFILARQNELCPSELRLRLVGGGPMQSTLENRVKEVGLTDYVEFVGPVAHEQVPAELRRLDVYLALSREESLGVAILEAMACGVPVIVSDAPGPKEIVSHGSDGIIVAREDAQAAADSMVQLLKDPTRRSALARAGRKTVEDRYDWAENVRDMVALYRDILR